MIRRWLSILISVTCIFVIAVPLVNAQPKVKSDTSNEVLKPVPVGSSALQGIALNDSKTDTDKKETELIEVIQPLNSLSQLPPTSYVPQDVKPDKKFTLELLESDVYLGNNVMYNGFTIDGKIPGPTMIVNQNDIVEIEVVNTGKIPHGMSIHAAYTQTSKYVGQIGSGEKKSIKFKATYPGVYMYHCAPGGHAIPMHTMFGQYGMIVVLPDEGYELEKSGEKPDVELFLIQHEMYGTGKDAIEGNPLYVMFNGQIFRYLEDPVKVRPGDNVRIYFLNVGPNIMSTLHIVGVVWDHVYWQGHPDNLQIGGQTVLAGPSDSWVIDFRVPEDEGNYLLVTHAFGSATRGAIGALSAKYDHEEIESRILADGPTWKEEELKEFRKSAKRMISPYQPTDWDEPVVISPDQEKVTAQIIGNSFSPKVLKVPVGTEVEWVNEEVFAYSEGEYSGVHDVATTLGPTNFISPRLSHGEKFSYTFENVGEYEYICTPHPYMKGKVIVYDPNEKNDLQARSSFWDVGIPVAIIALIILLLVWRRKS